MKTFGCALLSYGLSGKVFHAPFLAANAGFKLLGAWERSKSLIQNDYPGVRTYRTLQEILNDPDVELVIVNTPTYTHYDYVSQVLSAGKHAVVEKAFTTTVTEAQELEDLAKRTGKLLTVYQNRRWDGDFLTVRDVVRSGVLGGVVEVQLSFERYNPELSPKAHREEPGPGAGNLMDLGPHLIDEALVLFGMPTEVFADLRACRPGSKVDDYFEVLLYYPALRVRLRSTYLAKEISPGFIIHGLKGSLQIPRLNTQEVQLRNGMKPNDPDFGQAPQGKSGTITIAGPSSPTSRPVLISFGSYMEFFNRLHKALEGSGPVPVTAAEGRNVMKILEAAQQSSLTGRKVSVQ